MQDTWCTFPQHATTFSCLQTLAVIIMSVLLLSFEWCMILARFHFKDQQNSNQVFSCCLEMTSWLAAWRIQDWWAAKMMLQLGRWRQCDFYRCKFQQLSECRIIWHALNNASCVQSFPLYCPLCHHLKPRTTHTVKSVICFFGVFPSPHFDLNFFFFSFFLITYQTFTNLNPRQEVLLCSPS